MWSFSFKFKEAEKRRKWVCLFFIMLFYVWAAGVWVCVCVCAKGHPLGLKRWTAHFTPPVAPAARLMHWPHSSKTDKERDRTAEIERVKRRGLKTEGDIPTPCSQTTSLRRFLIRLQIITLLPRNCNGCSFLTPQSRRTAITSPALPSQKPPPFSRLFCLWFPLSFSLFLSPALSVSQKGLLERLHVSFYVRISFSLFQFQKCTLYMCVCVRQTEPLIFTALFRPQWTSEEALRPSDPTENMTWEHEGGRVGEEIRYVIKRLFKLFQSWQPWKPHNKVLKY